MKRITWWPQAWLGLVFSWARPGRLAGGDRARSTRPALLLYAGAIFWVIGYDTIYALQDQEDDALVGVKSSALRARPPRADRRRRLLPASRSCCGPPPSGGPAAMARRCSRCCRWRCTSLLAGRRRSKPDDGADALAMFRSNRFAGLLMFLACLVVGTSV